jgi:hypothetical protein
VFFYRAALPLSRKTLTFVAGVIRCHRAAIGSLWRKLNAGQQALLVLAYLRKGETFAELATGFGVDARAVWLLPFAAAALDRRRRTDHLLANELQVGRSGSLTQVRRF